MKKTLGIRVVAILGLAVLTGAAQAWPIDHRVTYDNSGFWSHNSELAVNYALIGGEVAIGLWEGGESRIGKTRWQAIDSSAFGAVVATAGKYIFTRSRPSESPD